MLSGFALTREDPTLCRVEMRVDFRIRAALLRHENEVSGYIAAFSEEGQASGLERFQDWHAHLGGTMFPMQGYPDFSPFYIEISEIFGGFNFGDGVAQIDLKEMKLEWAC